MTSEVVAETSEGRIGLWDTKRYTRLTDWPSHGIGPHEIRLLPDGRLAVANGGIQTDPVDRTKLNIPDMRPNLTLLADDGALLEQIELPDLRQNSIRHLALCGDSIAFAMQWEGDPAEPVPQLGLWTPGQAPVLCEPPPRRRLCDAGLCRVHRRDGGSHPDHLAEGRCRDDLCAPTAPTLPPTAAPTCAGRPACRVRSR